MGLAAFHIDNESEGFRKMIHDEVDKWVDQIIDKAFSEDKQLTIMELSQLFSETKHDFFGKCFQSLIETKYAALINETYAHRTPTQDFIIEHERGW